MKNDNRKFVDLCPSDCLPCSCSVKGVGFGACVKNLDGTVRVCCRFSDVAFLEYSIREKIKRVK